MQIIPATPTHYQSILDIYNWAVKHSTATFDTESKSLPKDQDWFKPFQERYPLLVSISNDTVIGFGLLKPFSDRIAYNDTCELSIYIDPNHHGKGVGNKMMEKILQVGESAKFKAILSKIETSSQESIHLHKKYGFFEVGTLLKVGYKFDKWLDVLIMQKLFS